MKILETYYYLGGNGIHTSTMYSLNRIMQIFLIYLLMMVDVYKELYQSELVITPIQVLGE